MAWICLRRFTGSLDCIASSKADSRPEHTASPLSPDASKSSTGGVTHNDQGHHGAVNPPGQVSSVSPAILKLNATVQNAALTRVERASAIFSLFNKYARSGTDSAKIQKIFIKIDWRKISSISFIPGVAGWIPIGLNDKDNLRDIVYSMRQGSEGLQYAVKVVCFALIVHCCKTEGIITPQSVKG